MYSQNTCQLLVYSMEEFYLSIGERIKILRKNLGLTQVEFAARLKISKGFVSNLENNRVLPSEQLIRLMSYEFLSSEYWLTSGEGEMFLSPTEIVKSQIDRLGECAFYEALKELKGLVVFENTLIHRVCDNKTDPDLEHMIKFLYDLWAVGDDNFKAWARIQFARAFPPDMEEEIQKKLAQKQNEKYIG